MNASVPPASQRHTSRFLGNAREMLGGEVNGLKCRYRFLRRQSLLAASDRAVEGGLEAAIDPDFQVEIVLERGLEEEDALENRDVHVLEVVDLLAVLGRRLFRVVGLQPNGSFGPQRQDQPQEQFFEPEGVQEEILAGILLREPLVREI